MIPTSLYQFLRRHPSVEFAYACARPTREIAVPELGMKIAAGPEDGDYRLRGQCWGYDVEVREDWCYSPCL